MPSMTRRTVFLALALLPFASPGSVAARNPLLPRDPPAELTTPNPYDQPTNVVLGRLAALVDDTTVAVRELARQLEERRANTPKNKVDTQYGALLMIRKDLDARGDPSRPIRSYLRRQRTRQIDPNDVESWRSAVLVIEPTLDAFDETMAIMNELDFDFSSLDEPTRKRLALAASRHSLIEPLLGRQTSKTRADLRALSRVADAHARLVTAIQGLIDAVAVFMQKPKPP